MAATDTEEELATELVRLINIDERKELAQFVLSQVETQGNA